MVGQTIEARPGSLLVPAIAATAYALFLGLAAFTGAVDWAVGSILPGILALAWWRAGRQKFRTDHRRRHRDRAARPDHRVRQCRGLAGEAAIESLQGRVADLRHPRDPHGGSGAVSRLAERAIGRVVQLPLPSPVVAGSWPGPARRWRRITVTKSGCTPPSGCGPMGHGRIPVEGYGAGLAMDVDRRSVRRHPMDRVGGGDQGTGMDRLGCLSDVRQRQLVDGVGEVPRLAPRSRQERASDGAGDLPRSDRDWCRATSSASYAGTRSGRFVSRQDSPHARRSGDLAGGRVRSADPGDSAVIGTLPRGRSGRRAAGVALRCVADA